MCTCIIYIQCMHINIYYINMPCLYHTHIRYRFLCLFSCFYLYVCEIIMINHILFYNTCFFFFLTLFFFLLFYFSFFFSFLFINQFAVMIMTMLIHYHHNQTHLYYNNHLGLPHYMLVF